MAWRFVVEDAALADRVDAIDVELREGGCAGPAIFEAELVPGVPSTAPPRLADGVYGVFGSARGADCRVIAEACEDVTFPLGVDALELVLAPMGGGAGCAPGDPGAADVALAVGEDYALRPISPWIYGISTPFDEAEARLATMHGASNSRFSSYNWESGLSNTGAGFASFRNDLEVAGGDLSPASAFLGAMRRAGPERAYVLPLALLSHVAFGAETPDVREQPDYLATHFVPNFPARPGPPPASPEPDPADGAVYQDDLVRYVEARDCAECAREVIYALDVQPDNWHFIYEDVLPDTAGGPFPVDTWIARSLELACAVKRVEPTAQVIGPWMSGFIGAHYSALPFIADYARAVFDGSDCAFPLIDAFALSWHSEPISDGDELTGYLHAARSLYDPTYSEPTWIPGAIGGPIELVPRLRAILDAASLPNVGVALARYHFQVPDRLGARSSIAGAIALAEALGAFGSEGVRYALHAQDYETRPDVIAAFSAYRDYDGLGGTFGDRSIPATSSDLDRVAIFASTFEARPEEVVLVAINRSDEPIDAAITLRHRRRMAVADVFTITEGSLVPVRGEPIAPAGRNAFVVGLPPLGVVTISLRSAAR